MQQENYTNIEIKEMKKLQLKETTKTELNDINTSKNIVVEEKLTKEELEEKIKI